MMDATGATRNLSKEREKRRFCCACLFGQSGLGDIVTQITHLLALEHPSLGNHVSLGTTPMTYKGRCSTWELATAMVRDGCHGCVRDISSSPK
jgi:hypothetical protein